MINFPDVVGSIWCQGEKKLIYTTRFCLVFHQLLLIPVRFAKSESSWRINGSCSKMSSWKCRMELAMALLFLCPYFRSCVDSLWESKFFENWSHSCLNAFAILRGPLDEWTNTFLSAFFVRYFALKPKGKPPLHAAFDFFFLDWVYCH